MQFTALEILVAIASLLIFVYRGMFLMAPMLTTAIQKGNASQAAMSMTLLV